MIFICGAFAIGVLVGWKIEPYFTAVETGSFNPLRVKDVAYPLIDPLLSCRINATVAAQAYSELQTSLEDDITHAMASKDITRASVFLRNLESSEWLSVNGDDTYSPSSLMKILTLIAYLRISETTPGYLDQTITATGVPKLARQNVVPSRTAIAGKTYTIRELITMMIVDSDNASATLLTESIDPTLLQNIMTDLEMAAFDESTAFTISPRLFSRFLTILYNSTYLSRANSEYALELLTQSTFADGIIRSIPTDISVAHKFGENTFTDSDGVHKAQLHECGIVYRDEPYLLCVMTEGTSQDTLPNVIQTLTKTVDNFMAK
jgi:beta-lactamase class A